MTARIGMRPAPPREPLVTVNQHQHGRERSAAIGDREQARERIRIARLAEQTSQQLERRETVTAPAAGLPSVERVRLLKPVRLLTHLETAPACERQLLARVTLESPSRRLGARCQVDQ